MTQQQQTKKFATYINWNSVITGVCTSAILWMGAGIRGMYNDLKNQPIINERQDTKIANAVSEIDKLKAQVGSISNEQIRQGGKLIYLEAIMPDKNQFKIKK